MENGGDWAYTRPNTWASRTYRVTRHSLKKIVDNKIPALLLTGSADAGEQGIMGAYAALQNAAIGRDHHQPMRPGPGQRVSPRYQIIFDDQPHCKGSDVKILEKWFDTWLKKEPNPDVRTTRTPIHILERPTGRWVNASTYPFVDRDPMVRYLRADGKLGNRNRSPRASTAQLAFTQPDQPNGIVTFTTPRARRPYTIAGIPSATIYAKSTSTNLHLITTLVDVAPDGSRTEITDGNVLGSQSDLLVDWDPRDPFPTWFDRDGNVSWAAYDHTGDRYLQPGKFKRLEVSNQPVLYKLQTGHRLALEIPTQTHQSECAAIAPENKPCYYSPAQQRTLPGTYSIRLGGKHPTTLRLPIVDGTQLPTARSGRTATSAGRSLPLDWRDKYVRLED